MNAQKEIWVVFCHSPTSDNPNGLEILSAHHALDEAKIALVDAYMHFQMLNDTGFVDDTYYIESVAIDTVPNSS